MTETKKYRATCDLCGRTLPATHDSQSEADRHALSLGWVRKCELACSGCDEAMHELDHLHPGWMHGQEYVWARSVEWPLIGKLVTVWFAWRHPGSQRPMNASLADVTALTPAALLESIRDSDSALWAERVELVADTASIVGAG